MVLVICKIKIIKLFEENDSNKFSFENPTGYKSVSISETAIL